MNIATHVLYILIAIAFGFTLGFWRALVLCKPMWVELKNHGRKKLKTKWPKEIETKEQDKEI